MSPTINYAFLWYVSVGQHIIINRKYYNFILMMPKQSSSTQKSLKLQTSLTQKQTIHMYKQLILTTRLLKQSLFLQIKVYDLPNDHIDFFELTIHNSHLHNQLTIIFGNLHCLYHTCFAKHKNYHVYSDGTICLTYKIVFQDEYIQKQHILKLQRVEKPIQLILRQVLQKQRQMNETKIKQKLQQMKKQFVEQMLFDDSLKIERGHDNLKEIIIPILNECSGLFKIDKNVITYISLTQKNAMMVLDTRLVNQQCYQFTVRCIGNNQCTLIGVISQENINETTSQNNINIDCIYYEPYLGTIRRNGAKKSDKLVRSECKKQAVVKITVNKAESCLNFKVTNNLGKIETYRLGLGPLGHNGRVYPMIQMYDPQEQVQVTFS